MKYFSLLLLFFISHQLLAENIQLKKGDRVVLYGNSLVSRLQENGTFEALVQLSNPGKNIEFRSLAWTGDQVGYRLRPERYVNHLKKLVDAWPANYVILGFGLYESFAGEDGLKVFKANLHGYIKEIQRRHPGAKIIILSPPATEDLKSSYYPEVAKRNKEILAYSNEMKLYTQTHKLTFIDLYKATLAAYATSSSPLTVNGIHLNDDGHDAIGMHIAKQLLGKSTVSSFSRKRINKLTEAISRKASYVKELVRPVNTVLYFGVRGRAKEYKAEIPRYHQIIAKTDKIIHAMAADPKLSFNDSTLVLKPLMGEDRAPIISAAKIEQQMKVAEGFKLNLFASEKEFPELRNPEQIAFDSKGRLWVVTMPSFPGTVPGDKPQDKIIILEDTDKDGKADKSTVFADGLSVPDGLAFYKDGVIISHQPKLVFMKDTDGDGKADYEEEILRGIDVTDAHHGGMIAMDPLGDLMFCDGVFHRSQLETPYGVTHGIDATTYRLNLRKGSVKREYQTLTPNPWKITWDRWGNLFQMYGDGFVQDSNAIPWTPFGIYHPLKQAITIAYGKGSGAMVISSPNFPEKYQQGMASAVLLRKCFVSLSKNEAKGAYHKASDRLDVLSSPNQSFRPVDIAFGFDGAMYVSDFCSRIIGHAQNSMRDPRWDGKYGRIWRVIHTGKPVVKKWPEIDGASTNELLELLKHPQNIIRDHARRKLRNTKGIVPIIDSWIKTIKKDELLLEALWVLQANDEVRQPVLEKLLESKDQRLRAAAVSLIRFQSAKLENPMDLLKRMTKDKHLRVRTEVIKTVSYLQEKDEAFASLLGEIDTAGDKDLKTIIADASYGAVSNKGPEIPVMNKPKDAVINKWLKQNESSKESYIDFAKRPKDRTGTIRTFVFSPENRRALLSIKHSYVKVFINGIPVIATANFWSSEWNVQVELNKGLNEIKSVFSPGRKKTGMAPVYLFNPLGVSYKDIKTGTDEASLKEMAKSYDADNGVGENAIRISAVTNQLAFTPTQIRLKAGKKVKLTFNNPDIQIHNLVIVKPGSEQEVGLLADKMIQDPDAMKKSYVPDSDKVVFYTPLLNGKQKITLDFNVPKEPGKYPFICTFPGHWRIMKGTIIVYK